MIFKGSRYEGVPVETVTDADGKSVPALALRLYTIDEIPPTASSYQHIVIGSDRLDLLAYQFYQNAEKFWIITDGNPDMDPEGLLDPGRAVHIPPDRT